MKDKLRQVGKSILFHCLILTAFVLLIGCTKEGNQETDKTNTDVNSETEASVSDVTSEQLKASEEADESEESTPGILLEDGIYTAEFDTDGSMFHVNETLDGKGTLTVKDGEMVIHISLPSKNIINLFVGLSEDAEKEGAELLEPTIDTILFSDGLPEDVHGFDIPVPAIGEEFDVAILGKKGKWYDHKVIVSNPVKKEADLNLEDGEYKIGVTLEGGSGRATITSPLALSVNDGKYVIYVEWSSPNYDYMLMGSEKYEPVNTEGNSIFELPLDTLQERLSVVADTTAMGNPHEVEYVIVFDFDSIKKEQ